MIVDDLERAADAQTEHAIRGNKPLEVHIQLMFHNLQLGRPITQFKADLSFQKDMKTPGFEDEKKLYTSYDSSIDLISALNDAIVSQQKELLQAAPFIGLIIDEYTNVAVYKKLIIYARYARADGIPAVDYLQNINVADGTARTITEASRIRFGLALAAG